MGRRCNGETKNYPLRNRNGVRSASQRVAPTNNFIKNQPKTNISRQEEKLYLSRSEPKELINSCKANSIITVNPTVLGVRYYGDNRPGGYQMVNPHQLS